MNFNEFVRTYNPIKNELVEDAAFDGFMFEAHGKEFDFIANDELINGNKVWTVVDGAGSKVEVISGAWQFNRLGYIVTKKPYDGEHGDMCFVM